MKLTLLINDNYHLKLMHISPAGNKPDVNRLWHDILQAKYSKPRIGPVNLYGVNIDDYELEQPFLIGVLKGHVQQHQYEV